MVTPLRQLMHWSDHGGIHMFVTTEKGIERLHLHNLSDRVCVCCVAVYELHGTIENDISHLLLYLLQ